MMATKGKDARPLTLITGGTGFLGAHLVRLLAAREPRRACACWSTARRPPG